ncbi:MAG: GGDEF domain-containing protein [bacterium]|nr:GGDEF domain-containing protein [bacterium]
MGVINKIKKKFSNGISVRKLSLILSLITSLIFILTYRATVEISYQYNKHIEIIKTYFVCERAAQEIMDVSDILTENSRLYVLDGKKEYLDEYFEESNIKRNYEKALLEIKANGANISTGEIQNAVQASSQLRLREYYAMRLAADARNMDLKSYPSEITGAEISAEDAARSDDEKLTIAKNMLYDGDYVAQKNSLRSNVNQYLKTIVEKATEKNEDESKKLEEMIHLQSGFLAMLLIAIVIVFSSLIFLFIRPLDRFIKAVSNGQAVNAEGAMELRNLAETYNTMHASSDNNMKLNKELKKSNITDILTGVYNRKGFDEIKQQMKDTDKKIAFLLIDIDKFKTINDLYGHPVGDHALRIVAGTLKKFFRSNDFIFRAGGDEFAVFMTDVTEEHKDIITRKIDSINAELSCYQMFDNMLSISAGVAFSGSGYDKEVYNAADSALYESKKNGRKRCSIYKETL